MQNKWKIACLVGVLARVALAEVAFVPEYPMPGLDGLSSGAMLSWSGPAADTTFEFLKASRLSLRSENGVQEVSSPQMGCVRFFHSAPRGLGPVESTHCTARLVAGATPMYWGTVRTDNLDFFDVGLGVGGARAQLDQSSVEARARTGSVSVQLRGTAAAALSAAKPARQAVSCMGSGLKAVCSFRVDTAGRLSSK